MPTKFEAASAWQVVVEIRTLRLVDIGQKLRLSLH
jgi:hypothetical protein